MDDLVDWPYGWAEKIEKLERQLGCLEGCGDGERFVEGVTERSLIGFRGVAAPRAT